MPATGSDTNLVVGSLALMLEFVTRDELAEAVRVAFQGGEPESLIEAFRRTGVLSDDECELLAALVNHHLARHNNDAQQSLAHIDSSGDLRRLMSAVVNDSLPASAAETIGHDPAGADPHATRVSDPHLTALQPTENGASDVSLLSAAGATTAPLGTGGSGRRWPAPLSRPAVERFHIIRPFQKGGLGQVSLARDEELGREVALKEILPSHADSKDARQRFLIEAEITGSLEHPGVVPVYGLGQYADGRPFYAMRLIRGDNLLSAIDDFHRQQLAPDRELRFRQLLGRFIDVCNAIEYAHNRCVLHRDLKPGNIMLGKYGETLVVDWGLAKTLGSEIAPPDSVENPLRPASAGSSTETRLGRIVGTPAYMSPEQATGRVDMLGPATDVYSLGATLYHLLVGRAAFQTDDAEKLLANVQQGRFEPPRAIKHDVPKPLEAICLKAMSRQPTDRYASARELADDVERYLGDEQVIARPNTLPARVGRWARKHRGTVVTAGVALTAIAAALAAGVVLLNEANRRAENNFAMARNAIFDYVETVRDDNLLKQSQLRPLRDTLLRRAMDYYKQFLENQHQGEALLDEVAQANFAVGQITEQLDSAADAIAYYEKAADIGARLVAKKPDDEQRLAAQARTLDALGGAFQRLDRLGESQKVFARAEALREQLVEKRPENAEYLRALANTMTQRAVVDASRGDARRGAERQRQAQRLRAERLRSGSDDVKLRADAARGEFDLGQIELSEGDRAAARERLEAAVAEYQRVLVDAPTDVDSQFHLAETYRALGDIHAASGDEAAARTAYDQARALLKPLVEANPDNADYSAQLDAAQAARDALEAQQ